MITFLSKISFFITFLAIHIHTRSISNSFEIKDLFTTGSVFDDTLNYWDISNPSILYKYLDCSERFFGGNFVFFLGSSAWMTYNTPQSHNVVYFSISLTLQNIFMSWDGLTANVAGTGFWWSPGVGLVTGGCDFTDIKIKGRVPHTGSTLTVQMVAGGSLVASFGLRKVFLRLATESSPAPPTCVTSQTMKSAFGGFNNQCPCPVGQFGSPGSCANCDQSCEECYGPSASECYACAFSYYYDGTQCVKCTPTCTDCGTCKYCSEANFYMDDTCVTDCKSPFSQVVVFDHRYCLSPCQKNTEIVYADGSCRADCPAPLIAVPYHTRLVCSLPCPSTKVTVWDGTTYTCSSSPCVFPLKDIVYGGSLKVCRYPCDIGTEVYYSDNSTCMSSCNFPYKLTMYGTVGVCQKPCSPTQYYQSWDLTCQNSCNPLFQKAYVSGVWVCYPPQCGAQFCQTCGPPPTNQCQDYYFCNTTGTNARFCLPYYKYNLNIDPIRPVLNGVTLLVQVDPLLGIDPGFSDTLDLSIMGYQVQTDYIYTINKISTGTFQVEILIQRPVNSTGMRVSFYYGAGLSNDYVLPRITYIDESTQIAAQAVNEGSQIAFLLFAISIIGTVFSGGMSSIWTAMPESQYAYYLLYLNVDYLHHTEVYFESLSNYDILMNNDDNPDQAPLDLSNRDILPRKFFILAYDPDFFDNTVQVFEQTLIVLIGLGFAAFVIRYIRFSGRGMWILRFLRWIRNGFMWNMLIRQMLTYTLPLFISCFIEIYRSIFSRTAYFPSLFLAVWTMLFFLVFFFKLLSLINNMPTNKRDMVKYNRLYGTLWEDLDTDIGSKYYYWMVAVRGAVLAYLLVFLAIYPYVQVILLILFQGCIVSLFLGKDGIRKVFQNDLLNKVTMTEEISLLVIKIMILVYMVMTLHVGDKTLILVGWLMVLPGAVSQIVQTMYSNGIQINAKVKEFKAIYRVLTKNKIQKLKKIKRINRQKPHKSPSKQLISTAEVDLTRISTLIL